MRPTRSDDTRDTGAPGDAALEVRIIGGGQAKRGPADHDGGLEIGLQIGAGQPAAPAGTEANGEIYRLEAAQPAEPLRARPMTGMEPAAPYVPRKRRKKPSMTLWTAWMAAGTCMLTVAAVAGIMATRKPAAAETAPPIAFATGVSFSEEKTHFLEHAPALIREAESLLARYTTAKSPDEVLPLLRDPERVADRFKALWRPIGGLSPSLPVTSDVVEQDSRMTLVLAATRADYSRLEAVFVREDGHLKLDWEASMGIGDAQLAELRASASIVKGVKVRVKVSPGNFYTPEFPEADFHSYQLADASGEAFVWAYARRGSSAAAALDEEFNENSVILEKAREARATLRISGPLRQGVNLFEITEMLHKGWVSP